MIPGIEIKRVCLVLFSVDFRNGHSGLLGISKSLNLEPSAGDLIIFINRRKNSMKFLIADKNGLWVAYKKFRIGTVGKEFKFLADENIREVPMSLVKKLIEGSRFFPNDQK